MFACLRKTVSPVELFEEGRKSWNQFSAREQNEIVQQYLPKVRYLAHSLKRRVPANMEFEDIFNAGVLGLLEALHKFDAQAGTRFSTYAENRVNGAMLDELRRRDPLSRGTRALVRKVSAAAELFERRNGRLPSDPELARAAGLSLEETRRGLQAMEQDRTADMDMLAETLSSDAPESGGVPCSSAIRKELVANISACLARLSQREQFILSMSYVEEYSLKEIASALKITEGRVSQLRTQALRRLKELYVERYGC